MKLYLTIGVVFVALVALSFFGGVIYHKHTMKPLEAITITNTVYDTVDHYITNQVPYYITRVDSIVIRDTVFKDVDTSAIVKDYFTVHYYTRVWEDSLLKVTLKDAIAENRSIDNTFTYKILRPQTITHTTIDNSVSYSKYFSIGVDVPIKDFSYIELEGFYHWSKGYLGLGYTPELKSLNVKLGAVLFKR